eukprot:6463479-Pyramimonas_sp.AAC.1
MRRRHQQLTCMRFDRSHARCFRAEHLHDLNMLCVNLLDSYTHHILAHTGTSKSLEAVNWLANQTHAYLHSNVGLAGDNRNDIAFELEYDREVVLAL